METHNNHEARISALEKEINTINHRIRGLALCAILIMVLVVIVLPFFSTVR